VSFACGVAAAIAAQACIGTANYLGSWIQLAESAALHF
jgi:hypothetical protein